MKWTKWILFVLLLIGLIGVHTMPDAPDGYKYRLESQRHVLGDLAELAARLGSVVVHDRRGTVLWMDNFARGLAPWQWSGSGTGNAVKIIAGTVYRGPYAMHLTAGSDGDSQANIYREFAPSYVTSIGASMGFAVGQDFDYIRIYIARFADSVAYEGRLYIRDTEKDVAIWDENADITSVGSLYDVVSGYERFHEMKLVVDFDDNVYVRAIINDVEIDLSDYPLYTTATAENPSYAARFRISGRDGENDEMVISHVVITIDEP